MTPKAPEVGAVAATAVPVESPAGLGHVGTRGHSLSICFNIWIDLGWTVQRSSRSPPSPSPAHSVWPRRVRDQQPRGQGPGPTVTCCPTAGAVWLQLNRNVDPGNTLTGKHIPPHTQPPACFTCSVGRPPKPAAWSLHPVSGARRARRARLREPLLARAWVPLCADVPALTRLAWRRAWT